MVDKKLHLYLCDEEYGKRLLRYLNSHRHPGLRVEMVTERERFWERRGQENHKGEYWLTDDVTGMTADAGDRSSLWILADHSDADRHRIGYTKKASELLRELIGIMELPDMEEGASDAPPAGIYGVYSPGEEGAVAAALLSQEFGAHGRCVYVNLREFPYYYMADNAEGNANLGELFFRLENTEYNSLVGQSQISYGKATRLPAVSHYRDLWDISDQDREHFFRRLQEDCGQTYVVILFNDIREVPALLGRVARIVPVCRKGMEEVFAKRWRRYLKTEKCAEEDIGMTVTMPEGWTDWIPDMENQTPENWLRDEGRQQFVRAMWEEVSR